MKSIVIGTASVFGATEASEGFAALNGATKVFRSDNLENLDKAVKANDKNFLIAVDKVKIDPPSAEIAATIKGFDVDHPFITKELPAKKSEGTKEILRAWRYIAVVK